jgi:hypothetical protein
MKEIGQGLVVVLGMASGHIANKHKVFGGALRDNLREMIETLKSAMIILEDYAQKDTINDSELSQRTGEVLRRINAIQLDFLHQIDEYQITMRSSELYLGFLQLARELISRYTFTALLQRELNDLYGYFETSLPPRAEEREFPAVLISDDVVVIARGDL